MFLFFKLKKNFKIKIISKLLSLLVKCRNIRYNPFVNLICLMFHSYFLQSIDKKYENFFLLQLDEP